MSSYISSPEHSKDSDDKSGNIHHVPSQYLVDETDVYNPSQYIEDPADDAVPDHQQQVTRAMLLEGVSDINALPNLGYLSKSNSVAPPPMCSPRALYYADSCASSPIVSGVFANAPSIKKDGKTKGYKSSPGSPVPTAVAVDFIEQAAGKLKVPVTPSDLLFQIPSTQITFASAYEDPHFVYFLVQEIRKFFYHLSQDAGMKTEGFLVKVKEEKCSLKAINLATGLEIKGNLYVKDDGSLMIAFRRYSGDSFQFMSVFKALWRRIYESVKTNYPSVSIHSPFEEAFAS